MFRSGTIFSAKTNPNKYPNQHAPPQEKEKLKSLLGVAEIPIVKISTVFPFDLFPDSIIVDTTKVNIVTRQFFAIQQIHSIPIKNIIDVSVETGPFFATIRILPQMIFQHQTTSIHMLWKSDAMRVRDIIQGLIVAIKENITVTKLPEEESKSQLTKDLEQLGKVHAPY